MNSTLLATAAIGVFGTSIGLLAQADVASVAIADGIPWANLASSSGMLVAMGFALRYVTLRQTATEESVNKANAAHTESIRKLYEDHTKGLMELLQQEKNEGKEDREMLRSVLKELSVVLNRQNKQND